MSDHQIKDTKDADISSGQMHSAKGKSFKKWKHTPFPFKERESILISEPFYLVGPRMWYKP